MRKDLYCSGAPPAPSSQAPPPCPRARTGPSSATGGSHPAPGSWAGTPTSCRTATGPAPGRPGRQGFLRQFMKWFSPAPAPAPASEDCRPVHVVDPLDNQPPLVLAPLQPGGHRLPRVLRGQAAQAPGGSKLHTVNHMTHAAQMRY